VISGQRRQEPSARHAFTQFTAMSAPLGSPTFGPLGIIDAYVDGKRAEPDEGFTCCSLLTRFDFDIGDL
jgi:hypothetical protein